MKQHITKKQWEEVCKEGDKLCVNYIDVPDKSFEISFNDMSIGGMIEYLGDDLDEMVYNKMIKGWRLEMEQKSWGGSWELCDALWEAVKYKLKV